MRLRETRRQWEMFGRTDPLWAICTDEALKNNRWSADEFFGSGESMIDEVMTHLQRLGVDPSRGRALDFGCGVGRLTQPLCRHFDTCDGVDVATSMIELARSYNSFGQRCRYHANSHSDLRLFDTGSFDFVLSLLVLQHLAPAYAKRYIAEFVRVLKPGGVAYFQVPDSPAAPRRPALPHGSHQARLSTVSTRLELRTGEQQSLALHVVNASAHLWPAPAHEHDVAGIARVGNHWLTERGQMVIRDDGRTSIPHSVGAGEEVEVELLICAPQIPGSYLLECDMVEEGVTWFGLRGSPTLRIPVTVTGDAATQEQQPSPRASLPMRVLRRFRRARSSPVMEMHCVPRDAVVGVVEDAGGRVIDIAGYVDAGEGYVSFRYVVTR